MEIADVLFKLRIHALIFTMPTLVILLVAFVIAWVRRRDQPRASQAFLIAIIILIGCLLPILLHLLLEFAAALWPPIGDGFADIARWNSMTRFYVVPFLQLAAWGLIVIAIASRLSTDGPKIGKLEEMQRHAAEKNLRQL